MLESELHRLIPDHFAGFKNKFRNQIALQHSFFGDLLLRMVIARHFQFSHNKLIISFNNHNKPSIQNRPDFHFNISHSGEWVVAAFSNKQVGIDIEKIKPANFAVADRFFSVDEVNFLNALDEKIRDDWFFRFWTIKESYLKAIGTGLSKPLSSFVVSFDNEKINLMDDGLPVAVNLHQMDFDRKYKLSVCAFEEMISDTIEIVDLADLLENYRK